MKTLSESARTYDMDSASQRLQARRQQSPKVTYTLQMYRHRPGSWSYTIANSVGGSSSMGNWRSKSAILNVLAFRGYDAASITAVETYHWTGTNWRRIGGAT